MILAKSLAHIHNVPMGDLEKSFLLAGKSEALWFLKPTEKIPDYISIHPKRAVLWQAIADYLPNYNAVKPSLLHIDYWAGNVLWDQGAISAIVDWEEAAQGAPGIDAACCRMDLILSGMPEAAGEFLAAYAQETGKPVPNLRFWELAAAGRPMFSFDGHISESPAKERTADFVNSAARKLPV